MKKMKRLLSLVLSFILVIAMAIPALADETPNTSSNSLVLKDKYAGHTYEAYQIFKGTEVDGILSNVKWGVSFNADLADEFLAALQADSKFGTVFDEIEYVTGNQDKVAEDIANAIAKQLMGHDAQFMQDFADLVHSYTENTDGTITYTYLTNEKYTSIQNDVKDGDNYVYYFENIPDGYYLVKDQDDSLDSDSYDYYTRLLLLVVGDVVAQPKGSVPRVSKTVADSLDGDFKEFADIAINDSVYFKLEGTLPANYDKYETYQYEFHDTLSIGLDVDGTTNGAAGMPAVVSAYVESNNYAHTGRTITFVKAAAANEYKVLVDGETYEGTPETGDASFEYDAATNKLTIKFYNLKTSIPNLLADDKIVIVYKATLNEDAIVGNGIEVDPDTDNKDPNPENNEVLAGDVANENKVSLVFSNNPQGDGTGTTPADDAEVFTYQLNIHKVGEHNQDVLLGDAYFVISNRIPEGTAVDAGDDDQTNNTRPDGGVVDNVNDYCYPVYTKTDGIYIATDWIVTDVPIVKMNEVVEGGVTKYYALDANGIPVTVKGTDDVIELTNSLLISDATNPIRIKGIDAGAYRMRELKAPAGYNLLEEAIPITITAVHNKETSELTTFTVVAQGLDGETDADTGIASFKLLNTRGATLPSTGGMGTTLFYVIGGLLVVAAMVMLITRKRMSGEE